MVAPGLNPNDYLQLEALTFYIISVQAISTIWFPCIFTCNYLQADSGKDGLFINFHYTAFTTIHLLWNGHCISVHESGRYHQAFLQCKDEHFWFVMRLFSSYFSFFNPFYPSLNSTHVHIEKMFINTKQFLTLNIKVLSHCSFIENAQCLPF